jgi:uncharacterized protein (DUF2141 family)
MKKTLLFLSIILSFSAFQLFSQSAKTETFITFHVTGFENNSGQAMLHLYRKTDDVPKKPYMVVKAKIVNKDASFAIKNLPYGDYAAIIMHDENGNGKIDNNFGMPTEPMGFSNNWKFGVFSGMPSFEKLKFTYSATKSTINIKMDN